MANDYIKGLQLNREIAKDYYQKSIVKTEQQKLLERILASAELTPRKIADIACGGGTLSYHLGNVYPDARFFLNDSNAEALDLARSLCAANNFEFFNDDIFDLKHLETDSFDLVFCWQTLSWIDRPKEALDQMLCLLKKGGRIYASSLFNLDHDVDIYARLRDHTRLGNESYSYNTYSGLSVRNWLADKAEKITFHRFVPEIDFHYDGRGLGTYTIVTDEKRLQISGGYLLNWAILEIIK